MPELPEVETIRRELDARLPGRRFASVRLHHDDIVLAPSSPADLPERLTGRRVEAVLRRAKFLLFRLEPESYLQVQLRMTGRFALARPPTTPDGMDHLAAEFALDDGRTLYYDDVRRLGGLRLLSSAGWRRIEGELGPEPLEEGFTPARLERIVGGRRAPVKNLLLDQRRVAGIGNIYASESLHRARIDPRRPGGSLDPGEVGRLRGAIRATLREALGHAGTTLRDYRAVSGRAGRFQRRLQVYGREGEECGRCGAQVRRIVQAGRSTYFCPGCQE